MRYLTKQKRLVAIFDAYYEAHGKQPCTMEAVAEWALGKGLYPIPKRGDDEKDCLRWEETLDAATKK